MNVYDYVLVNVFTGDAALGNPCCVMMMDDVSDSARLSQIAGNMNMPATSFLKPLGDDRYAVRWFAPDSEIDLCGHGTLGAAQVLHNELGRTQFTFQYGGGEITAAMRDGQPEARFARIPMHKEAIPTHIHQGFHGKAVGYYPTENKHVVLFEHADDVAQMKPDWEALRTSDIFSYAITAPGKGDDDCWSRVMLPFVSFLEDQATGSAHLSLCDFWAARLGKNTIHAYQASARGGRMICHLDGEHVRLQSHCEVYARGTYSA